MTNDVTVFGGSTNLPTIDSRLGIDDNDDLSAGVSGGFAVLSFRGSKWRIKSGGEEQVVMNEEGDYIPSLRVVILKGSPKLAKNYYAEGYVEGSSDSPDCFSADGVTPDPSAPDAQCSTCAACPHNQFGSRITESGKRAKACSDSRRLAIIPEGDFANETYGGPMLLRVPPASLGDLKSYAQKLNGIGHKYNGVLTKVSFDPDTAYPKLHFSPIRPLTADEQGAISDLLDDGEYLQKIENITNTMAEAAAGSSAATDSPNEVEETKPFGFEEGPPPVKQAATAPETKPSKPNVSKPKAAKAAKGKPKPAPAVPSKEDVVPPEPSAAGEPDDDELSSILASLDNIA